MVWEVGRGEGREEGRGREGRGTTQQIILGASFFAKATANREYGVGSVCTTKATTRRDLLCVGYNRAATDACTDVGRRGRKILRARSKRNALGGPAKEPLGVCKCTSKNRQKNVQPASLLYTWHIQCNSAPSHTHTHMHAPRACDSSGWRPPSPRRSRRAAG